MAQTSESKQPAMQMLLEASGFKRVVYVDDCNSITAERVNQLRQELGPERVAQLGVLAVDADVEDLDVLELRQSRAVEALSHEELIKVYDRLAAESGMGAVDQRDMLVFKQLSSAFGDDVSINKLSMGQWRRQREQLLEAAKVAPTLFVFDEDFRHEGLGDREGRRLLADVHRALAGFHHAIALLTHTVEPGEKEEVLQTEIEAETATLRGRVVVIGKGHLSKDRHGFVRRVKYALLAPLFAELKEKIRVAVLGGQKEALDAIEQMRVDSFERIMFNSSLNEGAWSPETVARVIAVLQEKVTRRGLRADATVHQIVSSANPICPVRTGQIPADVTDKALSLQRAEIYETEEDVNALHLPLEFGDMFEDSSGKYIVVAQACDLMVRSDGYRRDADRDARQMVPVVRLMEMGNKGESRVKYHPEEFELLHYDKSNQKRWYAMLNDLMYLPVWILDFAVFQANGSCAIASDTKPPDILVQPWKRRLTLLQERAARIVKLAEQVNKAVEANEDKQTLLHGLLRLPLDTPVLSTLGPPERAADGPWKLEVSLKRSGRLRERYATALLGQFASFISRLAHPHDLTRLEIRNS